MDEGGVNVREMVGNDLGLVRFEKLNLKIEFFDFLGKRVDIDKYRDS